MRDTTGDAEASMETEFADGLEPLRVEDLDCEGDGLEAILVGVLDTVLAELHKQFGVSSHQLSHGRTSAQLGSGHLK